MGGGGIGCIQQRNLVRIEQSFVGNGSLFGNVSFDCWIPWLNAILDSADIKDGIETFLERVDRDCFGLRRLWPEVVIHAAKILGKSHKDRGLEWVPTRRELASAVHFLFVRFISMSGQLKLNQVC